MVKHNRRANKMYNVLNVNNKDNKRIKSNKEFNNIIRNTDNNRKDHKS